MEVRRKNDISYRAIIVGILILPFNAYWIAMTEMVWHGLHFSAMSLPMNAVFIILLLLVVNMLLKRINPKWVLTQAELLTIYMIIAITTSIIAHDNMVSLMGIIPHTPWHATAENEWHQLFGMHLPELLVVNDVKIAEPFYMGDTNFYTGKGIVRHWVAPIFMWTAIIFLVFSALMCLNIILKRRWIKYEKLPYPIAQLPIDMTSPGAELFKNRLMWIGFAVAAVIEIVNGINYLYPAIPRFPIQEQTYNLSRVLTDKPWNSIGNTYIHFRLFLIGLCYLLPLDLSFSTWFFYIIRKAQTVVGQMFGWYSISGYPFHQYQAIGGILAIFVMVIVTGRHYFREVLKSIIGMKSSLDNPDEPEPLSYRTAFIGIIICFVLLYFICREVGMSLWVFMLFFTLYIIFAVSITRIRAQLGPPVHDVINANPHNALITTMGTQPFGRSNLIIFALFSWFNGSNRCHPMPHQLEAYKISDRLGFNSRKLLWIIMAIFPVAVLTAMWIYPYTLYKYGTSVAMDAGGQVLMAGNGTFGALASWLLYPKPTDIHGSGAILGGFSFSILLYLMRMRFIWWPFHPVGYVIGINGGSLDHFWFAMILSSTVKFIALKFGGARAYRRLLPFFLGLVLGDIVIGCYWSILSIVVERPLYVIWFQNVVL